MAQRLLFSVFLILVGCSNLTKNNVVDGKFILRSGVYKDLKWSDELEFKRNSWYREISLEYEALVVRVDRDNPFWRWFSADEKAQISECADFFVGITYSLDAKRLSHSMFRKNLEESGYVQVPLLHFGSHVKLHPDYAYSRLQRYRIHGYCRESADKDTGLIVSFPGYNDKSLF